MNAIAVMVSMGLLRASAWIFIKYLIRRQFPQVKSLSTPELAAWLAQPEVEQPLLLDARTPEEYAVSHLQGAHRLSSNLPDLAQEISATTATPIVVYCSVGYRSAKLAQRLQAAGYQQVFNLEGSIFDWVNRGYAVYQGERVASQVHPFNPVWGLLLCDRNRVARD